MKKLNYQLKMLCRRNRDGSHSTQANRERILTLIANQLDELGFSNLKAINLKQKHVHALVRRWRAEGISPGTMKNRMAVIRWWAEKVGKPEVVLRKNDDYKIPKRETTARRSKAMVVDDAVIESIPDEYVRASLRLQIAFGLRREESMKMYPTQADRGDHLRLQGSWTKGGRERDIPIETPEQRRILDEAKAVAGNGSLIPAHLNYKQHMKRFEALTHAAGIGRTHGFRHAKAQKRFEELAGFKAPVAGGPTRNEMSDAEKTDDDRARYQVSQELGHGRKEVTGAYLGGLISDNRLANEGEEEG